MIPKYKPVFFLEDDLLKRLKVSLQAVKKTDNWFSSGLNQIHFLTELLNIYWVQTMTKQHIFAKFNKIQERNQILKEEITLISKALSLGLQTGWNG